MKQYVASSSTTTVNRICNRLGTASNHTYFSILQSEQFLVILTDSYRIIEMCIVFPLCFKDQLRTR